MDDFGISPVMLYVFVFFLIVAVVQAIRRFYADQDRFRELWTLSTKLNLELTNDDPFNIPQRYGKCEWFSRGLNQTASNVLHGRLGDYDVKAFDFQYETSGSNSPADRVFDRYVARANGGRESHLNVGTVLGLDDREYRSTGPRGTRVHRFSSVILDTDIIHSSLLIRPEGIADRLAGAVGFDDIDFESSEFSRKFFVKSSDKKFAYDVIHPRMMEFLLASPQWNLQLMGRSVIICKDKLFTPGDFEDAITFARSFLELFPEYLMRQLREE